MATPIIYGTDFSTYVRTTRMTFEEKPAQYQLVDVSVIRGEQKQAAHLARNPFGTVPAFEHDGMQIYETGAIIRYVDQIYPGAKLTPEDPRERARMNQAISIIDYHGYGTLIGKIAVERLFTVILNRPTDEATVKAALPKAELCLKEWERVRGGDKFLAGNQVSLADLYLFPIVAYLMMTPEKSLIEARKGIMAWWEAMGQRSSVKNTQPNF
ncbi:MAG TPA: glutathione S-transferase family protein [Stellaceae bacterium]|nr:glutathione S-transferase family protein [Stellaceae bacterium]